MRNKNQFNKLKIIFYLSLIFFGTSFSNSIYASDRDFTGSFTITIPGDRLLKSIQLDMKLPENQSLKAVQKQKVEKPDSMVQLGCLSNMTFRKNRKGHIKLKKSTMSTVDGFFYIYDNVDQLDSFGIEPKFYSKNNEFHSSGRTDAIFILEVLELSSIADTEGTILKKIPEVSFVLGEMNFFDLNVAISRGKKVAVKLSSLTTDSAFIHFPVIREGKYPCYLLERNSKELKQAFGAPVTFSYSVLNDASKNFAQNVVLNRLVRQVNTYLKSHPEFGENKILEVPIQLKMSLAEPGEAYSVKPVIGPVVDREDIKKRSPKTKRRRRFLGL